MLITTLGEMKTVIIEELGGRDDLEDAIGRAIYDAIEAYEHRNWFFSQSRECVFNTTTDLVYYTPTQVPQLAYLERIHFMVAYIGTQAYPITPMGAEQFETAIQSGILKGEPQHYCPFGDHIGFYPAPSQAWQVRIGGIFRPAPPLDDDEANNPWMTKAQKLIRCRAKYELFLHRLRNIPMAEAMATAIEEAESNLTVKTNSRAAGGYAPSVESMQS